ncbi:MAG: hypothetical protein AMQ22_01866 [Candidatus Methanofastidiosum methylothiophilum]|uniref:Uncharacterized protein n=1 Tax=Candidatus Methanofastidiosum methylothiophilum TaxID=1705564 RepID=A0A150IU32_9EURY|nr:MAG: hypothetical protein AMQ22_01866 [Candidatus Methanofastidiosum methylthiophilus]
MPNGAIVPPAVDEETIAKDLILMLIYLYTPQSVPIKNEFESEVLIAIELIFENLTGSTE